VLIQYRVITHPDVTTLVRAAEDELALRYPDQSPSPLHPSARFVVAYVLGEPVGCGAFVAVGDDVAEIKRMFVRPSHRRTGVARRILAALERRIGAAGFDTVILETGTLQPEAMALYEGFGYLPTEPYGEYIGNPMSACFEKKLSPS
jgi:putative acetyltransferase